MDGCHNGFIRKRPSMEVTRFRQFREAAQSSLCFTSINAFRNRLKQDAD